ncbi:collectin-11-like [Drosophila novamexicana]|uniref:collectin-11-like n=1 Tax=Drosophila novamexicana TaxID=47314 RepID=UPI0011E5B368|nr:collectin-11-like [Drosophila novamexicana]
MKVILVAFLISILVHQGICYDSDEFVELAPVRRRNSSGCFKLVRPLIDYTIKMQNRFDEQGYAFETSAHKALAKITLLVNERFEKLENLKEPADDKSNKSREIYFLEEEYKNNWIGAAHVCRSLGGHLANVKNEDVFNTITEKIEGLKANNNASKHGFWVDINDLSQEGQYQSLTSGKDASFLKWDETEPDNKDNDEDCVEIRKREDGSSYFMYDVQCEKNNYFVCEILDE